MAPKRERATKIVMAPVTAIFVALFTSTEFTSIVTAIDVAPVTSAAAVTFGLRRVYWQGWRQAIPPVQVSPNYGKQRHAD